MVIAADLVVEVEAHHQEVAEVVQEVSLLRIATYGSLHDDNAMHSQSRDNNGAMCAPPMN